MIAHIEKGLGDPRQSTIDNQFYFRAGDDFVVAPYEMIKRLFSATDVPDLRLQLSVDQAVCDDKGNWKLGIAIKNTSTAMAEHVMASVRVMNPEACESTEAITFYDHSDLNPGMKIYVHRLSDPIHKGIAAHAGYLLFRMKKGQPPQQRLDLKIQLYANKMRSLKCDVTLDVGQQAIRIQRLVEEID